MNEFNEFIVKITEIRKYMFLTLVFLFLMLPVICTISVIMKSKNENKNKIYTNRKSGNKFHSKKLFINLLVSFVGKELRLL